MGELSRHTMFDIDETYIWHDEVWVGLGEPRQHKIDYHIKKVIDKYGG